MITVREAIGVISQFQWSLHWPIASNTVGDYLFFAEGNMINGFKLSPEHILLYEMHGSPSVSCEQDVPETVAKSGSTDQTPPYRHMEVGAF
jgi:hypothetical protein